MPFKVIPRPNLLSSNHKLLLFDRELRLLHLAFFDRLPSMIEGESVNHNQPANASPEGEIDVTIPVFESPQIEPFTTAQDQKLSFNLLRYMATNGVLPPDLETLSERFQNPHKAASIRALAAIRKNPDALPDLISYHASTREQGK